MTNAGTSATHMLPELTSSADKRIHFLCGLPAMFKLYEVSFKYVDARERQKDVFLYPDNLQPISMMTQSKFI